MRNNTVLIWRSHLNTQKVLCYWFHVETRTAEGTPALCLSPGRVSAVEGAHSEVSEQLLPVAPLHPALWRTHHSITAHQTLFSNITEELTWITQESHSIKQKRVNNSVTEMLWHCVHLCVLYYRTIIITYSMYMIIFIKIIIGCLFCQQDVWLSCFSIAKKLISVHKQNWSTI